MSYHGYGEPQQNQYNNNQGHASSYQGAASSYQGAASNYQGGDSDYQSNNSHQGNHSAYGAYGPPPDMNEASRYAKKYSKENEDDDSDDDDEDRKESVFSSILSKVNPPEEVDEQQTYRAAEAYDKVYNHSDANQVNSRDLGSAAAMQAFKMFSGGNNNNGGSSQLIGLAMGEATKLFKSQKSSGNVNQGEMLQAAVSMAMQLFMTQNSNNNNGGGMGAIMGMLGGLAGQQQAPPPPPKQSGVAGFLGKLF
ncbi:hypothetical protein BDB01DRAFT_838789 [Pilobolus umbonatus]|nr:hypothetical protein BDB01DRAFT_838789 [Pilobolus umbonatus]